MEAQMDVIEADYILACKDENNSNDRIELPINAADRTLEFQTLAHAFPNAIGLKFKNSATGVYRALRTDGEKFFKPDGGWRDKLFVVITERVNTRLPSPTEEVETTKRIISDWEERVFLVKSGEMRGSGVLISHKHILTAAHLSFKLGRYYEVRGINGREFAVECIFICKKFDFAVLTSTHLPEKTTPTDGLRRGSRYFVMGYPCGVESSKPTITKGIIKGVMEDDIHLVGTPGSSKGYLGAPVFDVSRNLAGIVTSLSINDSIGECLYSSSEQKYARILGISNIIMHYYLDRHNLCDL